MTSNVVQGSTRLILIGAALLLSVGMVCGKVSACS
jgi:hypothetical protein